jgi:DNA-binding NarL/FixJ family response regulator
MRHKDSDIVIGNLFMINIVLVDDQSLIRKGIRGLLDLTDDIRVIGEAEDGEQAIDLITRLCPDLVLLDIRMPKCSGIEVIKALKAAGSLPPCILLTTFDDDEALLQGMREGAKGFLLKGISPERLVESIRLTIAGKTSFRPAVTTRIMRVVQAGSTDSFDSATMPSALTERETEILALMAGGFSNQEIANALGSREGTVKNQVSSILSKLGVRDRVRAVLRGLELGWI